VLTKDDAVPTKPVSLRSTLTRRAAVVAGSAAAAALFATVPAPPAATPAAPAATPSAVATTPVVRLAATKPAAITLNPQAVAAAAPAAVRTSAMHKALGKVGSPYRYGAAGPNAFDCSGLVNWAYKSSGKSLPRSSSALSRVGTPVSKSALQPGDLVFFYKPVSHVGIYIGNGKIVHASNRKSPVKISDMGKMKFNSARRI
jgi:cell wall-associated NlpC family hydrolase